MEMTVQHSGGLHAAWLLNVCVCMCVVCVSMCARVCAHGEDLKAHLCEYQPVSAAAHNKCVQVCVFS